jgi:uroporphyrinogen decarboxylase
MNGRERVQRVLEGKDIDRPAFFLRCDSQVTKRVKQAHSWADNVELAEVFDADAIQLSPSFHKVEMREVGSRKYFDIFGNLWESVQYTNFSSSVVVQPALKGKISLNDIYSHKWPDTEVLDTAACVRAAEEAYAKGKAVYGGIWATIFTASRDIVGEEDFFVRMFEQPDFIKALIDRITDFYLDLNRVYMDNCGNYIDVYYFGCDFGTQRSMWISPNMFREFFATPIKRIVSQAKSYGKKVMFHSCGSIVEIIEDLIACGVDILDPVQVSAAGMNVDSLAALFKGRIAFNGGISTQTTFPFGTPEQVKAETIHAINTLGPYGYIVAPDQELIGEIPPENIEAFVDAVKEYKI